MLGVIGHGQHRGRSGRTTELRDVVCLAFTRTGLHATDMRFRRRVAATGNVMRFRRMFVPTLAGSRLAIAVTLLFQVDQAQQMISRVSATVRLGRATRGSIAMCLGGIGVFSILGIRRDIRLTRYFVVSRVNAVLFGMCLGDSCPKECIEVDVVARCL